MILSPLMVTELLPAHWLWVSHYPNTLQIHYKLAKHDSYYWGKNDAKNPMWSSLFKGILSLKIHSWSTQTSSEILKQFKLFPHSYDTKQNHGLSQLCQDFILVSSALLYSHMNSLISVCFIIRLWSDSLLIWPHQSEQKRAWIVLEEQTEGYPGPKVTGPKDITARICAKSHKAAIVARRRTRSRQMTKNFLLPLPLHPNGVTVLEKEHKDNCNADHLKYNFFREDLISVC